MLSELKPLTHLLQSYLSWLVNLSSGGIAAAILTLLFTLLAMLEFHAPRAKQPIRQLRQSYLANLQLFVFNSLVMSLLPILPLLVLAGHYQDNGLLGPIQNPVWKAALSFLAIDLLLYLLHKASHSFDFLWTLHKVHHNDPYLNVSTAFRLHFLELFIINSMKAALILVLGIESAWLLANEAITTFFVMLHHTNISLRHERFLGRIIITPYLHQAHHSTLRNEHDSNYGAVLSLWDRLFGTLAELKPEKIGVEGYASQNFFNLISCGLTTAVSPSSQPADLSIMIAEAAYYKAEKRGFCPGNELGDWLEAKSEIIKSVYGETQVKSRLNRLVQQGRDLAGTLSNAIREFEAFEAQRFENIR